MARIDQRNGKYRVRISQKDHDITHSFHDYETAVLWAKYKEKLINEITAFDVPSAELVNFSDAVDLKIKKSIDDNLEDRTIKDLQELHRVFECFENRDIITITFQDYVNFSEKFLRTLTTRGGNKNNKTGRLVYPTKTTLLSKFRRLSSVYSNLISNGIPVENVALKVGAYLNENTK